MKNNDYEKAVECFEYIKNFNKINVKQILEKLKIDSSNFYNFRCKKSDYIKVKKYIESEIASLYVIDEDVDSND